MITGRLKRITRIRRVRFSWIGPPGNYRLLALDEAGTVGRKRILGARTPDLYWEDPDFLREYEFRGEPITVDSSARMAVNPETTLLSN